MISSKALSTCEHIQKLYNELPKHNLFEVLKRNNATSAAVIMLFLSIADENIDAYELCVELDLNDITWHKDESFTSTCMQYLMYHDYRFDKLKMFFDKIFRCRSLMLYDLSYDRS